MATNQISAQEALSRMGYDLSRPQRGSLMVNLGGGKFKHYAFRYRVGDGHVLTRWGRVVGAEHIGCDVYSFRLASDLAVSA